MSAPTSILKVHQVPAGRRLDFAPQPGRFAYVYRRRDYQEWQCVARNACSPYFDTTFIPAGTQVSYVVCHCDAGGNITATTPTAHVQLTGAPLLVSSSGAGFSEAANA